MTQTPRPRSRPSVRQSQRDNLMPFLLAAVVLHAFFIRAVGFSLPEPSQDESLPALEVTLAQYYSDKTPDQADFVGQANQEGSGDADQANAPRTTEEAQFPDPTPKEVASAEQTPPPVAPAAADPVVSTRAPAKTQVAPAEAKKPEDAPPPQPLPTAGLLERSLEIASLSAQLDAERKLWAKRPRHKNLSSATIRSAADAAYLDQWRRRVERIGNLNYPGEARSNRIYGELMLSVRLYKDGTIKEVNVEQSSGQRILDEAARRIVHLAAPFAPLPQELGVDELTIVRTWRFEPGDRLAAQ